MKFCHDYISVFIVVAMLHIYCIINIFYHHEPIFVDTYNNIGFDMFATILQYLHYYVVISCSGGCLKINHVCTLRVSSLKSPLSTCKASLRQ